MTEKISFEQKITNSVDMANLHLAMLKNEYISVSVEKKERKWQEFFLMHDSQGRYYLTVSKQDFLKNEFKTVRFTEYENTRERAKMLLVFAKVLKKACKNNENSRKKIYGKHDPKTGACVTIWK